MKKRVNTILLCLTLIMAFSISASAAQITEHVFSQDVTAYVAASGRKTASELTPRVGYVAVHPETWGSNTVPCFPFGATIYTEKTFDVPNGGQMNVFSVQDIGDVYNTRGLTRWWFDIYIGLNTTANYNAAKQFGQQATNYTCVH